MGLFDTIKKRHEQRKGNAFIKSLKNKKELEVKRMYLDNKEIANNEIVLSHLFFAYPSIISVLPIGFQRKMINSNFNMFKYGSTEAKRSLVSRWLKDNKFIINSRAIHMDQDEYESYVCMYFNQPEDISKLYMEDLTQVLTILMKHNVKRTEEIVETMKDKLNERQWDFILKVDKSFIKYANQDIQKKYSDDDEYIKYINGPVRDQYIKNQIGNIKKDPSVLASMPLDIQRQYISMYPYMLNYIDKNIMIELLKYDETMVKYLSIPALDDYEAIYDVLDSSRLKGIQSIIDIFVDKSILNAKGKLYRFDKNSSNFSYQYNKRTIKIIQSLSIEQIISLINIDINYALPYIVPLYNDNNSDDEKKDAALSANSTCLNLFKQYYNDQLYSKYYKTINKIYSEYISHIDAYDYSSDYNSIFELFKILFNKRIILNNSSDKVNLYIGIMLLYKNNETDESKKSALDLFKNLIKNAYNYEIKDEQNIYEISSLELFDERISFIDNNLLNDFKSHNFVNISALLHIIKDNSACELFKYYYNIVSDIFGQNKEMLFKSLENFAYYKSLIADIKDSELSDEQMDNLVDVLASFNNNLGVSKKEDLIGYDLNMLKKLVSDLSDCYDNDVYKDLFCKYFFGKPFSVKGNYGWLDTDTLKQMSDLYDSNAVCEIKEDGERKYSTSEVNFISMIELLLKGEDNEVLLTFIDEVVNKKITRNILPIISLFEKLDNDKAKILNAQVVTIDDIESLYAANPSAVSKREEDGITIYSFNNQDFKILSSYTNDGVHYECKLLSEVNKNCYGYDGMNENASIRFTTYEGNTVLKMNKDNISEKLKPTFLVTVNGITPQIKEIAKNNNLKIIESSIGSEL